MFLYLLGASNQAWAPENTPTTWKEHVDNLTASLHLVFQDSNIQDEGPPIVAIPARTVTAFSDGSFKDRFGFSYLNHLQ